MKKPSLTLEQQNTIAHLYAECNTNSLEIAKKFDTSPSTVIYYLRKQGISIRNPADTARKYSFNENKFETIDSEEKAYWLGFLLADGYLSVKCNRLKLTLSEKDLSHLERFRDFMEGSQTIKIYENKINGIKHPSAEICFVSSKMTNDLIKLGFTNKKTFEIKTPIISKNLYPHFWRGVLDGDGWVSLSKRNYKNGSIGLSLETGICGNSFIIKSLKKFIFQNCKLNIKIAKDKNIFRIRLNGEKGLKFLNILYSNSTISLERKCNNFLKFKKYKESIENNKKYPMGIFPTKNSKFTARTFGGTRKDIKHLGTFNSVEDAVQAQRNYMQKNIKEV